MKNLFPSAALLAGAILGAAALVRPVAPAAAQAADKFEYKVVAPTGGTPKGVEEILNKSGGEGWRFSGYAGPNGGLGIIFERRK